MALCIFSVLRSDVWLLNFLQRTMLAVSMLYVGVGLLDFGPGTVSCWGVLRRGYIFGVWRCSFLSFFFLSSPSPSSPSSSSSPLY